MKRVVEFAKPHHFILPVIKYVCKSRGLSANQVDSLFTATCEKCGSEIPGGALAIAAVIAETVGSPGPRSSCKQCGHERWIAAMVNLSQEEETLLASDQLFKTLPSLTEDNMPTDFNWGKRKLSPEELDLLFCSPTFVQKYTSLFDFSDPLSAKSSNAKDRFLEQLTEEDVNRFIEEGRQVKKQFPMEGGGDVARGKRKRWWKLWK